MSTSVLKASPGKLDIKRHSPSILYISASLTMSTGVLKALPGKLDIKRHSPSRPILYISPGVLEMIASDITCKVHYFLEAVTMLSSTLMLTIVAIDRFFKTCK